MDLKKIKEMPPILIFLYFSPLFAQIPQTSYFLLTIFRFPRLYAVEMRYFP